MSTLVPAEMEMEIFQAARAGAAAQRVVSVCPSLRAGRAGVRHLERKQVAEKCSSRQFGLNMRNGIRSVII